MGFHIEDKALAIVEQYSENLTRIEEQFVSGCDELV